MLVLLEPRRQPPALFLAWHPEVSGRVEGSVLTGMIDLARLVDEARVEELPEVAAALELARVKLQLRLLAPPPPVPVSPPGNWLTPAEAAGLARATRRQVYEWAVGKRWAHRPTRRKLLIDEAGFRAWLGSRP